MNTDVFPRSQLELTDWQLRVLVRNGHLQRVRSGWYALPNADPDTVAARTAGGTLTAHSLLRAAGVWTPFSPQLHVLVPPNHPRRSSDPRVRLHYLPAPAPGIDELLTAVLAMSHCSSLVDVVCALDSLLERGLVSRVEIDRFAELHANLARAVQLATGLSQSGGETIVRLWLVSHRVRYRLQVRIDGVGRVDILVGDRLVIEVDGRAHHLGDQFTADRVRDRELLRRGYLVYRISYDMLQRDWQQTTAALLEIIRSGAHRWPRKRTGV